MLLGTKMAGAKSEVFLVRSLQGHAVRNLARVHQKSQTVMSFQGSLAFPSEPIQMLQNPSGPREDHERHSTMFVLGTRRSH